MLSIFARLMVKRWLWLTLGVAGALGLAFTLAAVAAIVARVLVERAVGREPDVEQLTAIALVVGLLAATAALVGIVVLAVVSRRGRIRRWVLLRQSMLHDAATVPATHLVQINSRPDARVGGRVQAVDLFTGGHGGVWLPVSYPAGSVVWFHRRRRWAIGASVDDGCDVGGHGTRGGAGRSGRVTRTQARTAHPATPATGRSRPGRGGGRADRS